MLVLMIVAGAPFAQPAATLVADSASAPITENTLTMFVGAVVTACTLTAIVTIFVLNKLSRNRGLTYQVRDQILAAFKKQTEEFRRWMTRHERGDDDRFDLLHREIYGLALRNAIKDRKSPPAYEPLPRRRSFDDVNADPMTVTSDVRLAGMMPMATMPSDDRKERDE